jgi:hypothetical protein
MVHMYRNQNSSHAGGRRRETERPGGRVNTIHFSGMQSHAYRGSTCISSTCSVWGARKTGCSLSRCAARGTGSAAVGGSCL